MLSREEAAAYCGISPNHFDEHVGKVVEPIPLGKRKLWDIRALDRFIDSISKVASDGSSSIED